MRKLLLTFDGPKSTLEFSLEISFVWSFAVEILVLRFSFFFCFILMFISIPKTCYWKNVKWSLVFINCSLKTLEETFGLSVIFISAHEIQDFTQIFGKLKSLSRAVKQFLQRLLCVCFYWLLTDLEFSDLVIIMSSAVFCCFKLLFFVNKS